MQFFSGWWFLIDAISTHPGETKAIHIILGIMGTISLVMVNSVTQAQVNRGCIKTYRHINDGNRLFQINGDMQFSGGCMEARGARIWIFVGFVLGFAAIIAAIWTMIADFNKDCKYLITLHVSDQTNEFYFLNFTIKTQKIAT